MVFGASAAYAYEYEYGREYSDTTYTSTVPATHLNRKAKTRITGAIKTDKDGQQGVGISAYHPGEADMVGARVETVGKEAHAFSYAPDTVLFLSNVNFSTTGQQANGINGTRCKSKGTLLGGCMPPDQDSNGRLHMESGSITVKGQGSRGIYNYGAMGPLHVGTQSPQAVPAYVESVRKELLTRDAGTVNIHAKGVQSHGIHTSGNRGITFDNVGIFLEGRSSNALHANDHGAIKGRRLLVVGNARNGVGIAAIGDDDCGEFLCADRSTWIDVDTGMVHLEGEEAVAVRVTRAVVTLKDVDLNTGPKGGTAVSSTAGRFALEGKTRRVSILTQDAPALSASATDTHKHNSFDLRNVTVESRRGALLEISRAPDQRGDDATANIFMQDTEATGDIDRIQVDDARRTTKRHTANSTSTRVDIDMRGASRWRGHTAIGGSVNLQDRSVWQVDGDATVESLTLKDATLAFVDRTSGNSARQAFHRLDILGNLDGAGRFEIGTDLRHARGDSIVVHGEARGTHTVLIRDSGAEPLSENVPAALRVIRAKAGGTSEFSLANEGQAVDLGVYRYELRKQQDRYSPGVSWSLVPRRVARSAAMPQPPGIPDTPKIPAAPDTPKIPRNPDTPTIPNIPNTPTNPHIPNTPTIPNIPNTPTNPHIPNTPTIPNIPNTPTNPRTPDTPMIPQTAHIPPQAISPVKVTEAPAGDAGFSVSRQQAFPRADKVVHVASGSEGTSDVNPAPKGEVNDPDVRCKRNCDTEKTASESVGTAPVGSAEPEATDTAGTMTVTDKAPVGKAAASQSEGAAAGTTPNGEDTQPASNGTDTPGPAEGTDTAQAEEGAPATAQDEAADTVEASAPAEEPAIEISEPARPQLSAAATAVVNNAGLAAGQALWNAQLGVLDRHTRALRDGSDKDAAANAGAPARNANGLGLWADAVAARQKIDHPLTGDYRQRIEGLLIGIDREIDVRAGRWHIGLLAGQLHSRRDFNDGGGRTRGTQLGAYATFLGPKGVYGTAIVSANSYRHTLHAKGTDGTRSTGSFRNQGAGVSLTVGRRVELPQRWFVDPGVGMDYLHVDSARYSLNNGMAVRDRGGHSLQWRAAVRVGRTLEVGNGGTVQPYVRLGYVRETGNRSRIMANGIALDGDLSGGRTEAGLGVEASLGKGHRLYADYGYAKGSRFRQSGAVTVGYQYAW
jgi:outer membrane autotransporter protein